MTGAPAVLTISRDRRGYEHFYLVQPASHRRGRGPARILYWFRTPPGIKVGRPPFDEEMRRRIEAQNPGVTFDWAQLEATPAPPPSADVERWRERRRVDRAEKAARAARMADLGGDAAGESEPEVVDEREENPTMPLPAEAVSPPPSVQAPLNAAPQELAARKRRRRRRRHRGARPDAPAAPAGEPQPPAGDSGSSNDL